MKKTFTTFAMVGILATGAAMADFTLEDSKGYIYRDSVDSDFLTSTTVVSTPSESGSGFTLTTSDSSSWFGTTAGSRKGGTILLTFDASKLTAPAAVTPLASFTQWGLAMDTDGHIGGTWNGGTSMYYTAGDYDLTAQEGEVRILITVGDNGTRIYVDSGTYWTSQGLRGASFETSNLVVSALASDALLNMAIWDTACFDTNDAAVAFNLQFPEPEPTPAVPEPATATLSLLALAGLATRRRRK